MTGEIVSAANMNTLRDALVDLDRRTVPVASALMAADSRLSAVYGAMAGGAGPAVSATIGVVGVSLITWSAKLHTDTAGAAGFMSVALSGSTTLGAADDWSMNMDSAAAFQSTGMGISMVFGGLTSGSMTATAQFRSTAGTVHGVYRRIMQQPLGS